MEDIKAIDILFHLFSPAARKRRAAEWEYLPHPWMGQMSSLRHGTDVGKSTAEIVAEMDETGYEKIFIPAVKMWSHRNNKLFRDDSIEEVYEQVQQFPDRFIGLAGYNPFRITESLIDVERCVKELGFKGAYVHSLGFNIRQNDRRMYPLYAKCVELDVPVISQVGHFMGPLPAEPGRPIYLDEVALEFPKLKFVASHTGWPWVEEAIAMVWKHENVYMDTVAHVPKYWGPSMVHFMNSFGRDKVLFGTGGMGMKLFKEGFLAHNLREETYRKVFRENAIKLFKL